jgi:hypothetical protein
MQQYYVAVGCAQSKLVTLLDLLRAVVSDETDTRDEGCCKNLRIGICCSSRDSCDEVVLGVAQVLANACCYVPSSRQSKAWCNVYAAVHFFNALSMQAGFKVACWHADLDPDKLAQTGRLFCDNNFSPSDTMLDMVDEQQRFVHPDDVRNAVHTNESVRSRNAHTLVCTDAALRLIPQVRH